MIKAIKYERKVIQLQISKLYPQRSLQQRKPDESSVQYTRTLNQGYFA